MPRAMFQMLKTWTDSEHPESRSWSRRKSEVLDGVGVRVGLLRILGVRVGIFDPTPTPKVQFNYFSTCFACLFLPAAQASSSGAF